MDVQNKIEKLDVTGALGISEALLVEWSSREYEGQPLGSPTKVFELSTHGALKLTLADGTVLVISTSEWCTVDYYAPSDY